MYIIQYNGYWIATDTYLPQDKRDENASLIWDYLKKGLGWTPNAVAGMLGNMDVESSMNPGIIQGRQEHNLIDNYTCLALSDQTGVGLTQWTGYTTSSPQGQKLASFAIRYNKNWYDGELQCFRLQREYETDIQFAHGEVDGVQWDWQTFVVSRETPEQLAKVFKQLYEKGGTDLITRQEKARYYFNLLNRLNLTIFGNMTKQRKVGKTRCLRI